MIDVENLATVNTVYTNDLTTTTTTAQYTAWTANYPYIPVYAGPIGNNKVNLSIDPELKTCTITCCPDNFTKIREVVPGKVVEATFKDGKRLSVCLREPDVFSIETALYYILAKKNYKLLKLESTATSLDEIVEYMHYSRRWKDKVEQGMDVWEEQCKKERRRKKRIEQKERRAQREKDKKIAEREEQIKIQEEAFLRAFKQIRADQIAEEIKHGQV